MGPIHVSSSNRPAGAVLGQLSKAFENFFRRWSTEEYWDPEDPGYLHRKHYASESDRSGIVNAAEEHNTWEEFEDVMDYGENPETAVPITTGLVGSVAVSG